MSATISLPPKGTAPAGADPKRIALRQKLGRWDVQLSPYLYISPFFILFAVVGLFPLAYTFWVSIHQWNLIGGQGKLVGLDNYTYVIGQPQFWTGLRNTFSIFLLSGVTQTLTALLLAAVLDQNIRAKTFWRMGVLLPYVVAPVAVGVIFSKMFADQSGLINALLGQLLLPSGVTPTTGAVVQIVRGEQLGRFLVAPDGARKPLETEQFLKLARGETAGDIAQALSLSVKTVSTYRTRLLEKMGLSTNSDLTYYALKAGLID